MEYVVTAWGENDKLIRKTFKYRKSAEKFGVKMVEKYNHCTITTFSGTEVVRREYYLTSFSVLMRNRNKCSLWDILKGDDNIDCS